MPRLRLACALLPCALLCAPLIAGCNGRRVVGLDPGIDGSVAPDAVSPSGEICRNGLDDNGDGVIDDGCPCDEGEVQACWPGTPTRRGLGACRDGVQTCARFGEFLAFGSCEGAVLPTAEIAANGIDEDCDGRDEGGGACDRTETACDDGMDEDCDGDVDCADSDCASVEPCSASCTADEVGRCTGGADDDCDGQVDCLDDDCASDAACDSPEPPPGCVPEFPFFVELICGDRRDNDCDGNIDCGDGDCRRPGTCGCASNESACTDGVDEDCDGDTDCADIDCQRCTPGATRWCEDPDGWGTQTCTDAERWGTCWSTFSSPSGCGGVYSATCCTDAGACCENYPTDDASVGAGCADVVVCRP